jgi:hypothetical protein
VIFPTTHVQSGGAYQWVAGYISQDLHVQGQLRDRVISAAEEDGSADEEWRMMMRDRRSRNQTRKKDGFKAIIGPVVGM